ncbi:MAG: hypothetical protein K2X66_05640 [Cyanobacteria bacterium]|nr:hypothetical protein [Cyanobacteriota bacterium]
MGGFFTAGNDGDGLPEPDGSVAVVSRLAGVSGLVASWEFDKGAQLLTITTGDMQGTVTTNGTTTVTGSGTAFTTQFYLGAKIVISGSGTYTVTMVASDTSMTVSELATKVSGANYQQIQNLCSFLPDLVGGNDMAQMNLLNGPFYDATNGLICAATTSRFLECFVPQSILNNVSGYTVAAVLIIGGGASDKIYFSAASGATNSRHRIKHSIHGASSNRLRSNNWSINDTSGDNSSLGMVNVNTGSKVLTVISYDGASNTEIMYNNSPTGESNTVRYAGGGGNTPPTNPKNMRIGADALTSAPGGLPTEFFSVGQTSNVGYIQQVHLFDRVKTYTDCLGALS